jgi:Protein of unknown function (DUF1236)
MRMRLFAIAAIGIVLATVAYAQSPTNAPSKDSANPSAAAPARERSKVTYSERDRDVIRMHSRAHSERRVEGRTTGSAVRTAIRVGERVPETVEIKTFPEEVYRDAPALREYRFIRRDSRTYVVDPRERMVIEEID